MNTSTGGAHKAGCMTVVVVNHGVVLIGEVTDLVELRDGAVHRKNTVCRDEDASCTLVSCGLQLGLEIGHIVVAIAVASSFTESHTVNNRCVVQLI